MRTLEPVVGADHVRASVHVEYDLSTSDNTEEIYDPKTTATLTQQKSERPRAVRPAGIPGTASNLPGRGIQRDGHRPTAESSLALGERDLCGEQESPPTCSRPGGSSASRPPCWWTMPSKSPRRAKAHYKGASGPEEMKIEQLARRPSGSTAARRFALSRESLFQEVPAGTISRAQPSWNTGAASRSWSGSCAIWAGCAVPDRVLLILRPVKKQSLTAFRELPRGLRRPDKLNW